MARLTKPPYPEGIIDGDITEPYQSIYEDSTAQKYMLGSKLEFASQGRIFRYAKAAGVALVQARMCESGVTDATYFSQIAQTGYARAADDMDIRVLVTTGSIAAATAATTAALAGSQENAFSGGWLVCNKVSPAVLGDIYYIVASKMVDETHIDLKLKTPWRNAMLATGEVTLTVSKFYGTRVFSSATEVAPACGVPLCPVAASEFYWSQVKGPAPLNLDGSETYAIGEMVGCPATLGTAGEAGKFVHGGAIQPWGVCMEIANAGTGGEPGLVDLCLE